LGQRRLLETQDLGSLESEVVQQVFRAIVLDDRVVGIILQDLSPALGGEIVGDEDELQMLAARPKGLTANDQNARAQSEWKKAFNWFGRGWSHGYWSTNRSGHSP